MTDEWGKLDERKEKTRARGLAVVKKVTRNEKNNNSRRKCKEESRVISASGPLGYRQQCESGGE